MRQGRCINGFLSRSLSMSLELINIGQQLTTMDRRLESSVNTSLRSTTAALQTAENAGQAAKAGQNEEKILKIVEQIQNISNMFDRKLQFRINKELDQVVVKVIDSTTDKVIREIPSAEIQKLQIRIKEALGLLFDESI
jgi:flagellar protein FlaG